MQTEYDVLCDDGESVIIEAEDFEEAFMIALERGDKPVSVGYAS